MAEQKMVKVRVKKAIHTEAGVLRPKVDPKSGKVTPLETVMEANEAALHNSRYVDELGPAKAAGSPADKQAAPAATK